MAYESFPSAERLKRGTEFEAVFKKGRRVSQKELLLWITPNNLSYNRVGISAPRRQFRLSSQRNRIRRLLREAYRKNREKILQGFDIVLMLQRGDSPPQLRELEQKLITLFARVDLLKC